MMTIDPAIQSRMREARELLTVAEQELELALTQLDVTPRGDKRIITTTLMAAVEKVNAARLNLDVMIDQL